MSELHMSQNEQKSKNFSRFRTKTCKTYRPAFLWGIILCDACEQVRLDTTQVAEASDLRHRLQDEMDILMAFQSKICAQTDALKQRERKELDERVSARRLQLLQKVP